MIKKIFVLLLTVLLLAGCSQEKVEINYLPMETFKVDMSGYKGVKSVDHCFVGTTVEEMDRMLKEGGSGIFYFGYVDCVWCQQLVRYVNEVGQDMGVTIYYIDAYNEQYPVVNTSSYDLFYEDLYDYLITGDDGEKGIYTPHVFTIINGEIKGSAVSAEDWDYGNPTEKQIEKIKKIYREMFEPFVS